MCNVISAYSNSEDEEKSDSEASKDSEDSNDSDSDSENKSACRFFGNLTIVELEKPAKQDYYRSKTLGNLEKTPEPKKKESNSVGYLLSERFKNLEESSANESENLETNTPPMEPSVEDINYKKNIYGILYAQNSPIRKATSPKNINRPNPKTINSEIRPISKFTSILLIPPFSELTKPLISKPLVPEQKDIIIPKIEKMDESEQERIFGGIREDLSENCPNAEELWALMKSPTPEPLLLVSQKTENKISKENQRKRKRKTIKKGQHNNNTVSRSIKSAKNINIISFVDNQSKG